MTAGLNLGPHLCNCLSREPKARVTTTWLHDDVYDIHMHLDSFNVTTNNDSKYITSTFT